MSVECLRRETEKRLNALGICPTYLPGFTNSKPSGPHIPIFASPPEILKARKRVLVLVNDATQDLGILAWRELQGELGINGASAINFIKDVIWSSAEGRGTSDYEGIYMDGFEVEETNIVPAVVIMNTGQLLYSHKHNQAMTLRSWSALPRKSVAHDMIRIHEQENRVAGHGNAKEHIKSVFEEVLYNTNHVAPDAEIYLIAIEGGADKVIDVLKEDCMYTQFWHLTLANGLSCKIWFAYHSHGTRSLLHGWFTNHRS